jgi:hypothetical protein
MQTIYIGIIRDPIAICIRRALDQDTCSGRRDAQEKKQQRYEKNAVPYLSFHGFSSKIG